MNEEITSNIDTNVSSTRSNLNLDISVSKANFTISSLFIETFPNKYCRLSEHFSNSCDLKMSSNSTKGTDGGSGDKSHVHNN